MRNFGDETDDKDHSRAHELLEQGMSKTRVWEFTAEYEQLICSKVECIE